MFSAGTKYRNTYTNSTSRRNAYNQSNVKSSKNAAIDKILEKYFKKNVALILFDDVSISTQSGAYSTVDNLYVNYKGEKICKLSELKNYYPGAYDKIINALAELAKKGGKVEQEKQEVKEEKPAKKKDEFSKAESFIDNINSMNQSIENEEITNGLYQTCELLKQIDVVDGQVGKVDPKLNKLYEYYLPILEGILQDYKRLSDSPAKTEEFKKTETKSIFPPNSTGWCRICASPFTGI